MFVTRRRYRDLEKKYWATRNVREKLARRNQQILPMVMNAAANLVPVFGQLESFGTDDADTTLLFRAVDGLAIVTLNPSTGEITVDDPNQAVATVSVSLDSNGALDAAELELIRTFRANVLFTQQYGGQVSGSVSLVQRSAE